MKTKLTPAQKASELRRLNLLLRCAQDRIRLYILGSYGPKLIAAQRFEIRRLKIALASLRNY